MIVRKVSRKCELNGDRVLGEYNVATDTITLFTRELRTSAREYGHDYDDLVAMTELHELGHRSLRLGRECTLTHEQEEQAADQYALWNFYDREGRKPMVNLKAWRST